MYAMSRMNRARRSIGRFLGVLALTGTALLAAATVSAPAAYADGATNCGGAWILCTTIQYGGAHGPARDVNGAGGSGGSGGGGYVSPCWLQPNTAWGDPNTDASSPTGLQQYFNDMAAVWHHDPDFQTWFGGVQAIYNDGKGGDPGIGLTAPPDNIGVSGGRWYTIACDMDTYTLSAYTAIQASMGVSAANLDYEAWFWVTDPKALPPGVQIITPDLLAQYAANHVLIKATFPALDPAVGNLQTVNLPVKTVTDQTPNGYKQYQTTATLGTVFSQVNAYPVSITYTANPPGLITPSSVTCTFNPDGTIQAPCATFTFTQPVKAGSADQIIATSTWNVTWTGNADYGEAGWTRPLPGDFPAFDSPITVQEIQTIN